MDLTSLWYRLNGLQVLYILWLLFLLNVFTFKQLSLGGAEHKKEPLGLTDRSEQRVDRDVKKILFWNAWYGDFGVKFDDESGFRRLNCKVSNCILSKNKSLVPPETADAVVFLYTNLCDLPKIYGRQAYQRFVLLTDDPPVCYNRNYYQRKDYFGSFFNWTISYRDNADIPWKRGWVKKLDTPIHKTALARKVMIQNENKKKKLVAWYVARCGSKSKREGYINELKEYIPIDSYGGCGNMSCPETTGAPGAGVQPCLDYLAKNYKFVLAFERFICDDFISKRFFDILNRDTVPIVFGGGDYAKVAPHNSFIDALQMSPKALANYLLKLDRNDRSYYRHFWWKGFYEVFETSLPFHLVLLSR